MLKIHTPETSLQGQWEWERLAEAVQFLRQMRVQANWGTAAQGNHVGVLIDPYWNTDHQTLCIRISCYAFGHQQVNWRKLAVAVAHPDTAAHVQHIACFDATGLAFFPSLPPAEYAIRVYERTQKYVRSVRVPVSERPRRVRTRGASRGEALAAHSQASGRQEAAGTVLRKRRTYTSADGKIIATLVPSREGMRLTFETQEQALAGQTVGFAFVTKAGDTIVCHGEVALSQQPPGPSLWRGDWPEVVYLAQPCELAFQVMPPA
jgi:hypothetical protein